ncbi:MAG TPA: translation initiation factor IF-2, partial [Pirellulaceae bacterium]|nr:translation initiation factor IF-2 [Pirellulaceae bacterium]
SELSRDQVELLLHEFSIGHVELKEEETIEQRVLDRLDPKNDPPESLAPRPPIVTFLGHVDHGKTSLLDAIIGTNVVAGEAGGITQHIRAYQIKKDNRKIAFVDTPGHEAFTEMRARGANVTDIAVLVIAADDGIMPQTEEAISHAKAAGVPIIVALNKIDLPGANPDKVLQELTAHDLIPSQWGGDVEVVPTSAIKGTGIDELLETILVTAELHDLKANPQRSAYGMCLEAEQESGRGVIAKMMVQGGALHPGDIVLCGAAHGRVKAMYDTLRPNVRLDKAGPSTPINLTGLDRPPQAGDKFFVLEDIGEARQLALACETRHRQLNLGGATIKVSLEQFQQMIESGTLGKVEDIVTLNLIIRADVRGSIEAIQKELSKIEHPEVRINILQALVGGVTIADVRLAQASRAVIIGFNVVPDEAARILAEDLQVEIRRYDIIYKVSDDIKATLEGRLKPQEQVVEMGMALVLRTFAISRVGTVAGCRVMRGTIQRDCRMRVIRDSRVIGEYAIDSLKREKDDAREVQRGMECGIRLVGFNDVKEGDTLEAYKIEQVARTL